MSGHTQGPWKVDLEDARPLEPAVKADAFYIATAHDMGNGGSDTLANAHLIAAAPELLEALKTLLAEAPTADGPHEPYERARVAIAKAEGREP